MEPPPSREPDTVSLAAHHFAQSECWLSWLRAGWEPGKIADAIAQHRHSVGRQLGHENAGHCLNRIRLEEEVRPVDVEVKGCRRPCLKSDEPDVTTSVTLEYRPAKSGLNCPASIGREFLSPRYDTLP